MRISVVVVCLSAMLSGCAALKEREDAKHAFLHDCVRDRGMDKTYECAYLWSRMGEFQRQVGESYQICKQCDIHDLGLERVEE